MVMKKYFNEFRNLIGAILAWIIFSLACMEINLSIAEMTAFLAIFGILTYSWTTSAKRVYRPLVFGLCTVLSIVAAVVTLSEPAGAAILAMAFQITVLFIMEEAEEI
ncbi:hypothetical protein Acj9p060 [Acinetobacter phage Acj9]|uniref:Uncharacterized protein n=1 Tax=Acinetobacter phage Acj9 TaxID=760939 RepID=E5EPJ4_9CAUD|nr:hypothetical protein Acj9p060 [Acinetobacter phage Acj9]ADG59960.1 hypothetical protein Acj9p060 [Acinetobacter phage Acj9]